MASPSLRSGSVLGRYEILEQVGAGGMGVVYRARDTRLEREVAIKVLACGAEVTASDRKHFHNEALSLSRLNHPNIATIHDFDSVNDVDFLVVEFIQGNTLDATTGKPRSEKDVIALAQQICDGLSAAHGQGIVHRDLKPGNVAVTPDGRVKILDFGLARFLPNVADPASTVSSLTYNMAGTLAYMAPEQLKGSPADQRSDIYALGIILYELLTGQSPYRVNTSAELAGAILHQALSSPRTIAPNISAGLEHVVLKCLEKDPELRYQSAKEIAVDLKRLITTTTISHVPESSKVRPRRRGPMIAMIGVMTLICAAVSYRYFSRTTTASSSAVLQSIAVLPLANSSSDPAESYLADALTGELTDSLTRIRALKVTSATTANHYRQSKQPLPEIAKELNVDAILSGSVRSTAGTVEVSLEVIEGNTDRRLWSKRYQRKTAEVAGLQGEVAQDIAREIKLAVSPDEQQRLTRIPTHNPQAYEAYLRAEYYAATAIDGSRHDAEANIKYAEEAIRLDPEFAEAYVTLAHGCTALVFIGRAGQEMDEKAFVALSKALSLNPNLPDAYIARGNLMYNRFHGFDIARSITDYHKAIELSPNSAWAHFMLGADLVHLGLHDRALQELDKAIRLDSHLSEAKYRRARALWQSNRFEESLKAYEEMDSKFFERAVVLAYLGRKADAHDFLERNRGAVTSPSNYDVLSGLALLSGMEGKRAETDRLASAAMAAGRAGDHFHHGAFVIACAYAELGATSEAVKWLRYTADNGMPNYPLMLNNPSMQKLHGRPEYEKFMQELKPRFDAIAANAQS